MHVDVDGHKIHALSRHEAQRFRDDRPYVVISISDPLSVQPRFAKDSNRKDILRLSFYDLSSMADSDPKTIWDFVEKHWDSVEGIVCHCEMGQSRSTAIAAAITRAKGGDDQNWFVLRNPSKPVYYKIIEAAYNAANPSEYAEE